MSKWPVFPSVYEINSWVWLNEMSRRESRTIGFGNVPEAEIERLAALGLDALWPMGIWQRSPAGRKIAQERPDLQDAYRGALSDFAPNDVVGSPYAVYGYKVDDALGGDGGLASLRDRLCWHGMRLILDFVPNHLACDHPWLIEHPERFVQGTPENLYQEPGSYFASARGIFAHGRAAHFPAWTDTVQLDYRVRETREAMAELLQSVADRCDGVRCDMAMLVTHDIFRRTWGGAFDPPNSEFWPAAIMDLRARHPEFLMLAEVYWDKEFDLQEQGFDYTYDRRLYDHLKKDNAGSVRVHLARELGFQSRLARFVENHDEGRALDVFGSQRSRAVATLALGLPGLRLFHEGQFEGYRRRLPVQLGRRCCEEVEPHIQQFYHRLLLALRDPVFQKGRWLLLDPHPAWDGSATHNSFVAYQWTLGEERRLVIVNLSGAPSQCLLPLRALGIERGQWVLEDLVGDVHCCRDGEELIGRGLYLEMPAYGYHLFEVEQFQARLPYVEPMQPVPGVKQRTVLRGHTAGIYCIAWSPDGHMLASAGAKRTICLWDVDKSQRICQLEGHSDVVGAVAWSPDGRIIASGSDDHTVRLWDVESRTLYRILNHAAHHDHVLTVAWSPDSQTLASGGIDRAINLWNVKKGGLKQTLRGQADAINCLAWSPDGKIIASGSGDRTVRLWDVETGSYSVLAGHDWVSSVAWSPDSATVASGTGGGTVNVWDVRTGIHVAICEGHTQRVLGVAFSPDGRLLASKSADGTVKLWRCEHWALLGMIDEDGEYLSGLAFQQNKAILATRNDKENTIPIWEVDLNRLLESGQFQATVHHTTGKIVLVGDHSVGKSALGYRMIHGQFKEQAATHGQHFWVFPALGKRRADGTECEAILWDLAGQPDYRLVNALFVDDADLALVLFDASDIHDPLHGVAFWLNQLQVGRGACPIILVAAQTDRGSCTLTQKELEALCRKHSIAGPIHTSALTGVGVTELIDRMKTMIPWDDKPATVTTTTFKRIKDYVLGLKETEADGQSIVTPEELRRRLEATDADWRFTDAEMLTAVGHLENYGYVKKLRTSEGEERILLAPELLNNLASSFVLEARRNPRGLGSLEETRLLNGGYAFPELARLTEAQRDVLLDAAALLFLEHNVCFRETDPLRMEPYLVFPELINLKRPRDDEDRPTEDAVAYTVSGATENVFASLVVLLVYTHTFTRTNQWQNQARYEVGDSLVCGFRQDAERDGELDFVLYFCRDVPTRVRMLFRSLFENFLARRNLNVMRFEAVVCGKCHHPLDRAVVRERTRAGKDFAFCPECGDKLSLPKQEPIQLTQEEQAEVDTQRQVADQRTRFEQAVFRVQNYVTEQKVEVPECFISYAWGAKGHERWVERSLAKDLQKAGIDVILDRWENARVGASVSRFVQRIDKSSHVVVVGTPFYLEKYANKDPERGYVVAAEFDMISNRMLGTEAQKESVLPILLKGEKATSFPALLHDRVYADFRKEEDYFIAAFDLILSLYKIAPTDRAVADLRDSLREPRMMR